MELLIAIASIVALLLIVFVSGYLKAPPDTAYIITGLGKKRILIGKAGWRVPFLTRVDRLSLRVMQVDVKIVSLYLQPYIMVNLKEKRMLLISQILE